MPTPTRRTISIQDPDYRMTTERILGHVRTERVNQEHLKTLGRFKFTCADTSPEFTLAHKLAVLVEEVGEVARDVLEHDEKDELHQHLFGALIQVAAVAVAWCEALVKANTFDEEIDADDVTEEFIG